MRKCTIAILITVALGLLGCGAGEVAEVGATGREERVAASAPAESATKKMSAEEQNAVESAQTYLDTTAFSRTGLIKQLKFEGYSTKAATKAVDSLNINFKEQAAKHAQTYLDTSSFSRSGLIKQLKFEGYTEAQAAYGVSKAGL